MEALALDILLEGVHAINLIVLQIVPAKVNAPVILGFVSRRNSILPVRDDVVQIGMCDIVRVLFVVSWVIRVLRVWVVYGLVNLLKPFFVSPLLVVVSGWRGRSRNSLHMLDCASRLGCAVAE